MDTKEVKNASNDLDEQWEKVQHRKKKFSTVGSKYVVDDTSTLTIVDKDKTNHEVIKITSNKLKEDKRAEEASIEQMKKQLQQYQDAIWMLRSCKKCDKSITVFRKKRDVMNL